MQVYLIGLSRIAIVTVIYPGPFTKADENQFMDMVMSFSFLNDKWRRVAKPYSDEPSQGQPGIDIPLVSPIIVPDIPLGPPITVPTDPSENFAGFTIQVGENWKRSVGEDYTTWASSTGFYEGHKVTVYVTRIDPRTQWTMGTGYSKGSKDAVYFIKIDPKTHQEVGRLAIGTLMDDDDIEMKNNVLSSGHFSLPVQWGEYSGRIHSDHIVQGAITPHNHGAMFAFLRTQSTDASIDADYDKLTLTKEDMDEFIAMVHSFKFLKSDAVTH